MDKLNFQQKTRTARNRLAEAVSRGNGTGSLAVPPSTLAINDNASTTGVNEGFPGQSAARDFAVPERVPVPQPKIEPPTSLQSSVDAGECVPVPSPKDVRTPKKRGFVLPQLQGKLLLLTFTKDVISFNTTKGKEQLSTTSSACSTTWITSAAEQSLQSPVTRRSSS